MRCSSLRRRAFPLALAGLPSLLGHAANSGFDPLAFDIGPVLVRPQGQVSETYNDNVFYDESNTKGDFISTIAPGADLSVGDYDYNHVIVEYLMPVNFYASHSILDGINQNLTLDGVYRASRLTIEAYESYLSRFGLLGGGVENTVPFRYENYGDSLRFAYQVAGKTSLYAKGTYNGQEFENGFPLIDYSDVRGTFGAVYEYSPKTSFFLEGYYGHVTTHSEELSVTPSGPTAHYFGTFAGLQGRLASRFTWYAKGGYEFRDYGNNTSAPGAVVAEVELAYNFNEKTQVDLRYRRANQTSIQYADQNTVVDSISASLKQKFGAAEKLEGAVTIDYYDAAYNFSNGALAFNNGRTDTNLGAGLDVKYHFNDWLTAEARYQFFSFDTTAAGVVTYDVNQFLVLLSIGYTKLPK